MQHGVTGVCAEKCGEQEAEWPIWHHRKCPATSIKQIFLYFPTSLFPAQNEPVESSAAVVQCRPRAEQWLWERCGCWEVSAWSQTLSLHSGLIYCVATSRLIQGDCVSPNSANERSQQGHNATQGPHSGAQCKGTRFPQWAVGVGVGRGGQGTQPLLKGQSPISVSTHFNDQPIKQGQWKGGKVWTEGGKWTEAIKNIPHFSSSAQKVNLNTVKITV